MTPEEASKEILKRMNAMRRAVRKETKITQKELVKELRALSSGPYGPDETRGWYAVRNQKGWSGSIADINVQTGHLRDGWTALDPIQTFFGTLYLVTNIDPIAEFVVHGTRVLIARRIDERAKARILPSHRTRIDAAVRKALNP